MPKIIENLREKLMEEARRQIAESGYAKTTVRSIASSCGVGTGTVYNYFSSKDMLIASFLAEDWLQCVMDMKAFSTEDTEIFLKNVHGVLTRYIQRHSRLFFDRDAAASFAAASPERHAQLRSQIADVIAPVCCRCGRSGTYFREFIAEAMLSWTSAGKSFEELWSVLKLLFDNKEWV